VTDPVPLKGGSLATHDRLLKLWITLGSRAVDDIGGEALRKQWHSGSHQCVAFDVTKHRSFHYDAHGFIIEGALDWKHGGAVPRTIKRIRDCDGDTQLIRFTLRVAKPVLERPVDRGPGKWRRRHQRNSQRVDHPWRHCVKAHREHKLDKLIGLETLL
jgi:hypothetical protein